MLAIPFPLSNEQLAAVQNGMAGKSTAINACAGSGKTHTKRAFVRNRAHSYPGERIECVPFMVSLRESEETDFAGIPNVQTANFHKRGKALCAPKAEVNASKLHELAKGLELSDETPVDQIITLVKMLKTEGHGIYAHALPVVQIAEKYGINPALSTLALQLLGLSDDCRSQLDFEDMLRFPVLDKRKENGIDWLILDEVQDYSPLAFCFIANCLTGPSTKVFMVGDPSRQALMMFAGANPELFDIMANHYQADCFSLTVNRRCSKAVVDAAPFKGQMQALDDAPTGEVSSKNLSEVMDKVLAGEHQNDVIISEANAPLVTVGISLLIKGIPCQMRANRIEALIKRYTYGLTDTRKVPLETLAEKVREKARDKETNELSQEATDIANCIEMLANYAIQKGLKAKPVFFRGKLKYFESPILTALSQLLTSNEGISLYTGHTAKGLEWNTVFHLPGKMKAPDQQWKETQSNCLAHVIATRAKLNHYTLIQEEKQAA